MRRTRSFARGRRTSQSIARRLPLAWDILEDRTLLAGFDLAAFGTTLQGRLHDIQRDFNGTVDTLVNVPLLGSQLRDGIRPLRELVSDLEVIGDRVAGLGNQPAASVASVVQSAIGQVFDPRGGVLGGDWLGDTNGDHVPGEVGPGGDVVVTTPSPSTLQLRLLLHHVETATPKLDRGLGFGLVDLVGDGTVDAEVTLDYLFQVTFDANTSLLTLDKTSLSSIASGLPATPLALGLGLRLSGLQLSGDIGGIVKFDASNLPFGGRDPGTGFSGYFGIDVGSDGSIAPSFTGAIDLGLRLRARVPGIELGVGADLVGHWGFANDAPARLGTPGGGSLAFHDVTLDVGSVTGGLLKDVIQDVQNFTGPLEPLYRVASTNLPILDDLGIDISLLDLLDDKAKAGDDTARQAALGLRFIHFVNAIPTGEGSGSLDLGDFNLVASTTPGSSFDVGTSSISPGLASGFNELTGGLAATYQSQGGFSFPFIEDPASTIFKVLLGHSDVDLFHFSSPEFHFHADIGLNFGVKGVLGFRLGGELDLDGHIEGGYDLTGIRSFVAGKKLGLLEGFHVDADPAKTYVHLQSFLGLSASVPLTTVSGGIHFDADIGLDRSLQDQGGTRVRLSKLFARISENPIYAFESSGEVYAAASLDVGVDLGFTSLTLYHRDLARVRLASFEAHYRPPDVNSDAGASGPSHIAYVHMTPAPDQVTVQPFLRRETRPGNGPSAPGQTVDVLGFDLVYPDHTETIDSVVYDPRDGSILDMTNWIALIATDDASSGDDEITIEPLVDQRPRGSAPLRMPTTNALLYGGPGNDTLVDDNPSIPAYLIGGEGNDYLGVTRSSLVLPDGTLSYYQPGQVNTVRQAYGDSAEGFSPYGNPDLAIHQDFGNGLRFDFEPRPHGPFDPILLQHFRQALPIEGGNDILVGMNLHGGPGGDSLIGTKLLEGGDGDDAISPMSFDDATIDAGAGRDSIIVDEFRSPLDGTPIHLALRITGTGEDSLIVHPFLQSVIATSNRPPLNDDVEVDSFGGMARVRSKGYSDFSILATGLSSLGLDGFDHVFIDDTHGTGVGQITVDLPRLGVSDVNLSGETSLVESRDPTNAAIVRVDRRGTSGPDAPVFITELRRNDTLALSGDTGDNFYAIRYEPVVSVDKIVLEHGDEANENHLFQIHVVDFGKGPGPGPNGLLVDATPLANAYAQTSYALRDGGIDVLLGPSAPPITSTSWFLGGTPVRVALPGPGVVRVGAFKLPAAGARSVTINRTWDTTPVTIDAIQQNGRNIQGSLAWTVWRNGGALTLLGASGDDRFDVRANSGTLVIDGQGGTNLVNLGVTGSASEITGTIRLASTGGATNAVVDGSSHAGARKAWVFAGFLFNVLPARVDYDPATTARLDITDNGQDDLEIVDVNAAATFLHLRGPSLRVSGTSNPVTVDVSSTLVPTVTFGRSGNVGAILGNVLVSGGPFRAVVDDSAAPATSRATAEVSANLPNLEVLALAPAALAFSPACIGLRIATSAATPGIHVINTIQFPVRLDTSGGTVAVGSVSGPLDVHNAQSVRVGENGLLRGISGQVTIGAGDAAPVSVTIDASQEFSPRSVVLGYSPSPSAGLYRVSGLSPLPIDMWAANLAFLQVNAGRFAPSTVRVDDTVATLTEIDPMAGSATVRRASRPLTVNGGSSVTIGDSGRLAGILADVLVTREKQPSGTPIPRILIDDSADTTARSATIDLTVDTRALNDVFDIPLARVMGLAPATISYLPSNVRSVTIQGGLGDDVFHVGAVSRFDNLSIDGGDGNDALDVGDLSAIQGPLSFLGGKGIDTLTLSNAARTVGETYTLTSSTVTVGASPAVTFDVAVDHVDLTTGSGDDLVKILSTTDRYGTTTVHAAAGDDRIDVLGKSVAGSLYVDSGLGRNTVRVGSLSNSANDIAARDGSLDGLRGYVYVGHNGGGTDDLVLDDSGHKGGRSGMVVGLTSITGIGSGNMFIAPQSVTTLTLHGGAGGNQLRVTGTYQTTTIDAGPGDDIVTIAAAPASRAQNITVNGQGGTDTVLVDDSASTDPSRYTLRGRTLSRVGGAPALYYAQPLNVTVDVSVEALNPQAGRGDDRFSVSGALDPSLPVRLDGGLGSNTLAMLDSPALWRVDGADSGTIQNPGDAIAPVRFARFGNLQGGTASDTFTMSPGGSLSGSLTGGNGVDTLDFGSRPASMPVYVNLRTEYGTSVAGPLSGLEVVNGGAGDDVILAGSSAVTINGGAGDDDLEGSAYDDVILGGDGRDWILGGNGNDVLDGGAGDDLVQGGNGNDTLRGGDGRDFLIGGAGADDLQGGAGDDLLIGSGLLGISDEDLDAIFTEWRRSDASYAARIGHLLNGGPGALNGSVVIRPSSVPDGPNSNVSRDGAVDRLEGDSGQDWYIALPEDLIIDLASDERVGDAKP